MSASSFSSCGRSVASVSSIAVVARAAGALVFFVRPSRRSPSGFSLVCVLPSRPLSHWGSLLAWFRGSVRRSSVGWLCSFPVSGVAGVPPAAVSRLAGCPVFASWPPPQWPAAVPSVLRR
jgi:hypothetical protein